MTMTIEKIETIADGNGYTYVPLVDVTYTRDDSGRYLMYLGALELDLDGNPLWEPFDEFFRAYWSVIPEEVVERANIHYSRYGH